MLMIGDMDDAINEGNRRIERTQFWCEVIGETLFQDTMFWQTAGMPIDFWTGNHSVEEIDNYIFENYAEVLKAPETIAKIIGNNRTK